MTEQRTGREVTVSQPREIQIVEDKETEIRNLETRFAVAVRQRELLEKYIKDRLQPDKHFYTVGDDPGRKPSLTKEGAELINLPHNLKPRYVILSGPDKPPADNTPYQITMNCSLWRDISFQGEGVGSASSYITTRSGGFQPRQKDPGLCYNATVKMACKSAYIAATLNATAASEFFTQDLEDDQTGGDSEKHPTVTDKSQHWCTIHNTPFFKKGKMTGYAHPVDGQKEWCHEPAESPKALPETLQGTRGGIEVKGSTATKEEVETLIETLGKELTEKVEAKASTATQRAKLFQKAKNMTYSEADLRNILERHYHKKNTIDLTSAEVEEFTDKVEAGATINVETGEWNQ